MGTCEGACDTNGARLKCVETECEENLKAKSSVSGLRRECIIAALNSVHSALCRFSKNHKTTPVRNCWRPQNVYPTSHWTPEDIYFGFSIPEIYREHNLSGTHLQEQTN